MTSDDILLDAIKSTAEKYVYNHVKVKVYYKINNYNIELIFNDYHTKYVLYRNYEKRESYIMRVVSDLCIELARHFNKERDFFYKRSDLNE